MVSFPQAVFLAFISFSMAACEHASEAAQEVKADVQKPEAKHAERLHSSDNKLGGSDVSVNLGVTKTSQVNDSSPGKKENLSSAGSAKKNESGSKVDPAASKVDPAASKADPVAKDDTQALQKHSPALVPQSGSAESGNADSGSVQSPTQNETVDNSGQKSSKSCTIINPDGSLIEKAADNLREAVRDLGKDECRTLELSRQNNEKREVIEFRLHKVNIETISSNMNKISIVVPINNIKDQDWVAITLAKEIIQDEYENKNDRTATLRAFFPGSMIEDTKEVPGLDKSLHSVDGKKYVSMDGTTISWTIGQAISLKSQKVDIVTVRLAGRSDYLARVFRLKD